MNRKYSLKKNTEIAALMKAKNSVGNKYYAIYYRPNQKQQPRIAISVSKKYGNAVRRNYEKRVTKEIIRKNFSLIPNYDLLIIIKKELCNLNFLEKSQQLQYLLNKIVRTGEKNDE